MSEKLLAEEHHSRWAETVLKAVADALEGKPVSDFMESFAVVRRAAELHAAEARCTALQQQLDETNARLLGAEDYIKRLQAEHDAAIDEFQAARDTSYLEQAEKAESALADLRGSITRLIAQWREEMHISNVAAANCKVINDREGRERNASAAHAYKTCADALEAALTPQGEQ